MALAANELGIIVVGLAVGYWVMSYVIEKRSSANPTPASEEKEEAIVPAWCAVLEVSPNSSRDEITRAYNKKIREYDPEKVADMGAEIRSVAATRAQEINRAYDEALRER